MVSFHSLAKQEQLRGSNGLKFPAAIVASFWSVSLCLVLAVGCTESASNKPVPNRPATAKSISGRKYTRDTGKVVLNYDKSPLKNFVALPPWGKRDGVEAVHVDLGVAEGEPGSASRVYIYRPTGEHPAASLPCVFVAAAGGTAFTGKVIGEGDDPELIPYAQNGFVAIGYETDGDYEFENEADAISSGFLKYRNSEAGLVNAQHAVEYVLKMMPEIDSNRLYAAGHSSAGRQAMLLAVHEPRMKAAISFNGVLNVFGWSEEFVDEVLEELPPGSREFLQASSPNNHLAKISCPVFLFHTGQDDVVPMSQSKEFADGLNVANKQVTTVFPAEGGHYQPMLDLGLPKAIKWLKELDKK